MNRFKLTTICLLNEVLLYCLPNLSFCLSARPTVCLSVRPSARRSVRLPVCLPDLLSTVPIHPTDQTPVHKSVFSYVSVWSPYLSLNVCLSECLFIWRICLLNVCLSVWMSILVCLYVVFCLPSYLHAIQSFNLYACLYVCISSCTSVYLTVCLSKRLFFCQIAQPSVSLLCPTSTLILWSANVCEFNREMLYIEIHNSIKAWEPLF